MRQEAIYEVNDLYGHTVCTGTAKVLSQLFCIETASIWEDATHGRTMLNGYRLRKIGMKDVRPKEPSVVNKEIIKCIKAGTPRKKIMERFGLTKRALDGRITRLRKRGLI